MKVAKPNQIKYYRDMGVVFEILTLALYYFRLYLTTCNGFPSSSEQRKLASQYFRIASKVTLGTDWKGVFTFIILSSYRISGSCVADTMPEYTEGMSKLVSTVKYLRLFCLHGLASQRNLGNKNEIEKTRIACRGSHVWFASRTIRLHQQHKQNSAGGGEDSFRSGQDQRANVQKLVIPCRNNFCEPPFLPKTILSVG